MATKNPIIVSFLQDQSIPIAQKEKTVSLLKDGMSQTEIASAITQKYGDKFSSQEYRMGNDVPTKGDISWQEKRGALEPKKKMGRREENLVKAAGPDATPEQKKWAEKIQAEENIFLKSQYESQLQRATKKAEGRTPLKRIGGALTETGKAAVGGAKEFGGGVKEAAESSQMEGAKLEFIKQNKELLKGLEKDIKRYEKEGDIEKLNEAKRIQERITSQIGGAKAEKKEYAKGTLRGLSKAIKGGTEIAVSPLTGAITGGFAPELEKAGGAISSAFQKLSPERQEQLKKIGGKIGQKWESLDPGVQDALSAFANLGGLGTTKLGGKITKSTASKIASASKTGFGKIAPKLEGARGVLQKAGKGFSKMTKGGRLKFDSLGAKKAFDNLAKIITPTLNVKNYRKAVAKGKAIPSKRTLFGKIKPSQIQLDNELAKAGQTTSKYLKDFGFKPSKITAEELVPAIDNVIGEIAQPLREAFKKIEVPASLKRKLSSHWEKIKRSQRESRGNLTSGEVSRFQKHFDDMVLNKVNQVMTTKGKMRKTNVEDLWNSIIEYDKSKMIQRYKNLTPKDPNYVYKEMWEENRRIARDAMDGLAETLDDVDTKQAFKDMSDLYKAKSAALDAVKPMTAAQAGYGKRILKKTGETLGVGAVGGGAYSILKG